MTVMVLRALSQAMPRNDACDKSTDGRTDGLTKNALSRHMKKFSYVTRGRAYEIWLWKTP